MNDVNTNLIIEINILLKNASLTVKSFVEKNHQETWIDGEKNADIRNINTKLLVIPKKNHMDFNNIDLKKCKRL